MLLLSLAVGCGKGASTGSEGGTADQYSPAVGMVLEYAELGALSAKYPDTGDTAGAVDSGGDTAAATVPTIRVVVTETDWAFENAEGPLGTVAWRLDRDGLWVGESHALPQQIQAGVSAEGVTVTETGSADVWYGSFPLSCTAEVGGGELSGPNMFAKDFGPILVTWSGVTWELVYYERATATDSGG